MQTILTNKQTYIHSRVHAREQSGWKKSLEEQGMKLWKRNQLTFEWNHQRRFTTGSIAYTKPLFRLVKYTILALPWSLTSVPDAVSDESLDGFKVWTCDHVLPGLKEWWTPKMFWLDVIGVSSQVESEEELRETSAEILGSFGEWNVKAEAWQRT